MAPAPAIPLSLVARSALEGRQQLIAHGRGADTPAALIQQGTTSNQRVFTGTLADLPELVASQQVQAPTLVIVGEVVTLRDKLAWFEGMADPA